MTAIRLDVLKAVVALLQDIDGVTETILMPSGDPVGFPALHVFDAGQSLIDTEPSVSRYELNLTVEGYIQTASGDDAVGKLNELYAATVRALLADDLPLGGLAETIDEGDMRVFTATLADKPRLGFGLDFTITFPTRREDPAQAPE